MKRFLHLLRKLWDCLFPGKSFSRKYSHVGYSHPGVPSHWTEVVKGGIREIEGYMWPQWWLPMWAKRVIHYLATRNSIVLVRSRFWHRIRTRLTRGCIIHDIKDKYAGLRVYGSLDEDMHRVVDRMEILCDGICESCGSREKVDYWSVRSGGWLYRLCRNCRRARDLVASESI